MAVLEHIGNILAREDACRCFPKRYDQRAKTLMRMKMIAYEVTIDGKPLSLAGVEDWSLMSLIVSTMRHKGAEENVHHSFFLGGMTVEDANGVSYHTRWEKPEMGISVGSEIRIRIVESEYADPPIKRYRSDREVQESPYTDEEIREMRYEEYLALKAEFEPGAS